jgi:lipoprotein-anchoring transpeptidase ErfK/SrfK
LRASIGLVVIAFALVGSLGSAAAQYYPPQPAPPPYAAPAPVYRDANGVPYQPGYVQPAGEDASVPPAPPYFAPQPMPTVDGATFQRPPADVSSAPVSADVTGSVRSPAAAPASPSAASPSAASPSAASPSAASPSAASPSAASPSAAATGAQPDQATVIAALPPEDQPEQGPAKDLPPQFRRQIVDFATTETAGTIIIDTPNTYLYLVLGNGKALRYGIGVGREGFTWTGTEHISRMKEWPDWFPPKEMIERQPYLPRFMAGGDTNPLGARAMYLGNTLYRIHGTNQPSTIGTFVSSGCIRLTNDDVEDLYSRVTIGTSVVVLPGNMPDTASAQGVPAPQVTQDAPIPPAPLTR